MFIKNLSISALSSIAVQMCNMIFWIFAAKVLQPSDLGLLVLVISTSLVFVLLTESLVNILIQKKHDELTSGRFSSAVCTTVIFTSLIYISVIFFFLPSSSDSLLLMLIGITTCVVGVFQAVLKSKLEVKLNFKYIAKVELFSTVLSSLLLLSFYFYLDSSIYPFSFFFLLVYLVRGGSYFSAEKINFTASRSDYRWFFCSLKDIKSLAWFTSVNAYVRNFDNYVVALNFGLSTLGLYSLAYKVMLAPVTRISGVIAKVLFPTINKRPLLKEQFAIVASLFRLVFTISLLLMALVFFFHVQVSEYFGFTEYEKFPFIFFWLCFSGVFQSVTSLCHVLLISKSADKQLFHVSLFYFFIYSLCFISSFFLDVIYFCIFYFFSTLLYFYFYIVNVYVLYSYRFFLDLFLYTVIVFFVMGLFISESFNVNVYQFLLVLLSLVILIFLFFTDFKRVCRKFNF